MLRELPPMSLGRTTSTTRLWQAGAPVGRCASIDEDYANWLRNAERVQFMLLRIELLQTGWLNAKS